MDNIAPMGLRRTTGGMEVYNINRNALPIKVRVSVFIVRVDYFTITLVAFEP